jgi:alanine-glyoxylate transaminase / serine-glyoxylate transaminase / serine-pyruvate transaminase
MFRPRYLQPSVRAGGYLGSDRFYHHTAPISMNDALREAHAVVVEEGLEARFARHALNGRALHAGVAAMGLSLVTDPKHRLPELTCVKILDGIDDMTVRRRSLKDWGIEIGGGLGPFKGQVWRIGLMGYGSRQSNVTLVLAALETCLRDLGCAQGGRGDPGRSCGVRRGESSVGRAFETDSDVGQGGKPERL